MLSQILNNLTSECIEFFDKEKTKFENELNKLFNELKDTKENIELAVNNLKTDKDKLLKEIGKLKDNEILLSDNIERKENVLKSFKEKKVKLADELIKLEENIDAIIERENDLKKREEEFDIKSLELNAQKKNIQEREASLKKFLNKLNQ